MVAQQDTGRRGEARHSQGLCRLPAGQAAGVVLPRASQPAASMCAPIRASTSNVISSAASSTWHCSSAAPARRRDRVLARTSQVTSRTSGRFRAYRCRIGFRPGCLYRARVIHALEAPGAPGTAPRHRTSPVSRPRFSGLGLASSPTWRSRTTSRAPRPVMVLPRSTYRAGARRLARREPGDLAYWPIVSPSSATRVQAQGGVVKGGGGGGGGGLRETPRRGDAVHAASPSTCAVNSARRIFREGRSRMLKPPVRRRTTASRRARRRRQSSADRWRGCASLPAPWDADGRRSRRARRSARDGR